MQMQWPVFLVVNFMIMWALFVAGMMYGGKVWPGPVLCEQRCECPDGGE